MSQNKEIHSLKKLAAQYSQQLDLTHLSLPNTSTIVRPDIQCAIYEHMFNEAAVWPLPPVGYRTRVLKTIIARIEEGITDPEEDVRPILTSFTCTQNPYLEIQIIVTANQDIHYYMFLPIEPSALHKINH